MRSGRHGVVCTGDIVYTLHRGHRLQSSVLRGSRRVDQAGPFFGAKGYAFMGPRNAGGVGGRHSEGRRIFSCPSMYLVVFRMARRPVWADCRDRATRLEVNLPNRHVAVGDQELVVAP